MPGEARCAGPPHPQYFITKPEPRGNRKGGRVVRGVHRGPGLLACRTGYAGSGDRSVVPARIPQHAREMVNILLAGRVNDVRGWTGPLRGEPDLLAGGLGLSVVEAAGCAAGPGGQRFRDCSQTHAAGGGDGHRPGPTVLRICPGGAGVRRRNRRDLTFPYCAPGVPQCQPKR